MIDIDLRGKKDIPEFQDFDKFCNSGKEAPEVSLVTHVTYAVKDIEVTAQQFIGTYRLPIQKQTLGEFMADNQIENVSEALLDGLDKSKGVKYKGEPDDEMAQRSHQMIVQKHSQLETVFTGNIPKSAKKSDISKEKLLGSYILFRTSRNVICERAYSFSAKDVAMVDLRQLMHLVRQDKKKLKKAKTFDDAVALVVGFADLNIKDAALLLQRISAGYKIWDILSVEEIHSLLSEDQDLFNDKVTKEEVAKLKASND